MRKFERVLLGVALVLFALFVLLAGGAFTRPANVAAQNATLEGRVKTLEAAQAAAKKNADALAKRVAVLETAVASRTVPAAAPVLAPTPTPDPAASQDPNQINYEIVSINSKVTESTNIFDKHAWIMKITNHGPQKLLLNATIEFVDKDGFIVDQDFAFNLLLGPHETKDFSGMKMVRSTVSPNITNVQAKTQVIAAQ